MMMWYPVFAVLPLCLIQAPGVTGHGRLVDPPSRSSMWRYGFKNPPNYDDNQLYCGGVQVNIFRLIAFKCLLLFLFN